MAGKVMFTADIVRVGFFILNLIKAELQEYEFYYKIGIINNPRLSPSSPTL